MEPAHSDLRLATGRLSGVSWRWTPQQGAMSLPVNYPVRVRMRIRDPDRDRPVNQKGSVNRERLRFSARSFGVPIATRSKYPPDCHLSAQGARRSRSGRVVANPWHKGVKNTKRREHVLSTLRVNPCAGQIPGRLDELPDRDPLRTTDARLSAIVEDSARTLH